MAEHRSPIEIEAAPEVVFEFLVTDAGVTSWMGQWAWVNTGPRGRFAVDIAGRRATPTPLPESQHLERPPPKGVPVSSTDENPLSIMQAHHHVLLGSLPQEQQPA